jgi:DNA-binding NtrC family response regulator
MMNFIAVSSQLTDIVKNLHLIKDLYVSTLIVGEPYIGKKTLASYIYPEAIIINGSNSIEEIIREVEKHETIILINFQDISNYEKLNFDDKRVIATSTYIPNSNIIDNLFGFVYELPSLKDRIEDAYEIANQFLDEATTILQVDEKPSVESIDLDLSNNSKSIQKSIYSHILLKSLQSSDIEQIMYNYLYKNLEGKNGYKEFLYLYEKPLIEAGLQKYKSQLKLAEVLGINRNTLRKKVNELGLD